MFWSSIIITLLISGLLVKLTKYSDNDYLRTLELINGVNPSQESFQKSEESLKGGRFIFFNQRLKNLGIFDFAKRRLISLYFLLVILFSTFICGGIAYYLYGIKILIIGVVVGFYLGLLLSVLAIRYLEKTYQRQIYFQTPLTLEALIIIVSSGLSLLPAIEKLSKMYLEESLSEDIKKLSNPNASKTKNSLREIVQEIKNPSVQLLRNLYQSTLYGLSLEQAFQRVISNTHNSVLRHMLIHLDISSRDGGELIPALKALSDFTHNQWHISVRQRLKLLESMVIFPIFFAVMGLMLVIAAVPISSLMKLDKNLQSAVAMEKISKGTLALEK